VLLIEAYFTQMLIAGQAKKPDYQAFAQMLSNLCAN
jgi:hypothetical protein